MKAQLLIKEQSENPASNQATDAAGKSFFNQVLILSQEFPLCEAEDTFTGRKYVNNCGRGHFYLVLLPGLADHSVAVGGGEAGPLWEGGGRTPVGASRLTA